MQLGSNVVALGDERVLVPASSKNLIAACRAEGLTVYDPDVSMIGNGGRRGALHVPGAETRPCLASMIPQRRRFVLGAAAGVAAAPRCRPCVA